MARTHTRVSRSLASTLPRSFTALASVARTLAESSSYCCAPARAASGSAAASAAARRLSVAATGEARSHVGDGVVQRHLGRLGIAAVLVLDHALLQPALAHHDAVRDADQLLVGEEHPGALVAIVEEGL